MTKWMKTGIAGLAEIAGTLAVTAAPAEAQRWHGHRHRDRDGAALAIGAGILGLGIAASLRTSGVCNDGLYRGGYG